MYRSLLLGIVLAGLLGHAGPAQAVSPATWTHEQPQDFLAGELDDLVVSSRGYVQLGRDKKVLHVPGERADAINAIAQAMDGRIYAASGPRGVIFRIDGDDVTEFAELPGGGTIFSLLFTREGDLLAGTGGGAQAVIYRIDGNGQAHVFYKPQNARYVWAMVRGPEGEIYAATGVEGKLFVIDPDGATGKELAQVKPRNLLCLAYGPGGMLYAGTDEDGHIYRINPANGSLYVMYDAPEPEISSIAIDREGNIFAATADAAQARPGRAVGVTPGGRPDSTGIPGIPATQPPDASQKGIHEAAPMNDDDSNGNDDDNNGNDNADDENEIMPPPPPRPQIPPAVAARMGLAVTATRPGQAGNAIYRIDVDGFVTEVFRETVIILDMVEHEGTLFAATGNEGRVYAIRPDREETIVLARFEPNQVASLLRVANGALVCGTANEAQIVRLAPEYAGKGTLTSRPLDAGQIVKWGRIHWGASIPEGTRLTVATRSGNVEDPETNVWDEWSGERDATVHQQIASPGARFLQYRVTFETDRPDRTPSLRRIEMSRIEENRPPRISELRVLSARQAARNANIPPRIKGMLGAALAAQGGAAAAMTGPEHTWVIAWEATDPNDDELEFEVFYREVGAQVWIRIAEELKEPFRAWDTRTVPDGRYEVRVIARDRPSNPPDRALEDSRISDTVLVDNTPPDVTIGAVAVERSGRVTINATMTDALSNIVEASYSVNSDEDWIPLVPLDDIFDSPNEAVSFTIDGLDPGPHRVALRVSDAQGNTRYVTLKVNVER